MMQYAAADATATTAAATTTTTTTGATSLLPGFSPASVVVLEHQKE